MDWLKKSSTYQKVGITKSYKRTKIMVEKYEADNSFIRNLNGEVESEIAVSLNDKFAELKDGTRLRISEKNIMLSVGDIIKTNYDTGPYVIKQISKHDIYGLETYSFIVIPEGKPDRSTNNCFLNEYVFFEGKVLGFFENNDDEILFIKKAEPKAMKKWVDLKEVEHRPKIERISQGKQITLGGFS